MAEYIDANFVSIKVNGNEGTGPELKKQMAVLGYPSVLLIDKNGEEIDRIVGYDDDAEGYLQLLKDYKEGRNTLRSYLTAYNENPNDVQRNFAVANRYLQRYERKNAIPYLEKILELDPENAHGHAEIARGHIAINEARANENIDPLNAFIAQSDDEQILRDAYPTLIRYYRKNDDKSGMIKTYEQWMQKFPENYYTMNMFAWFIYEEKLADHYARGIEVAQKAVELKPDAAHIWDTLAWLQFENGDIDDAIKSIEKAIDLNPEAEGFKKNLEKFKQSLSKQSA